MPQFQAHFRTFDFSPERSAIFRAFAAPVLPPCIPGLPPAGLSRNFPGFSTPSQPFPWSGKTLLPFPAGVSATWESPFPAPAPAPACLGKFPAPSQHSGQLPCAQAVPRLFYTHALKIYLTINKIRRPWAARRIPFFPAPHAPWHPVFDVAIASELRNLFLFFQNKAPCRHG